MMKPARDLPRFIFEGGQAAAPLPRCLPEETAIALSYNGSTHAVMMASPTDLTDFAYGFSLTEGIAVPDEIETVEAIETDLGIDLQIWLNEAAAGRQSSRRRMMAGPVGCGLCGIDSLVEARREPVAVTAPNLRISSAGIDKALSQLHQFQPLHDQTRAAHCAAFFTDSGILLSREDVGRHNALDKLIGALRNQPQIGGFLVTCRVSIDIVQKICACNGSLLLALSAPTAAAVDMAERAGLTLIGCARSRRFECFSHPYRIC